MSDRTPRQLLMAEHARKYRAMGYNPLPSRADVKRPAMKTYSEWRDSGVPDWAIDKWWGDNIQVPTGVRWDLIVVDLDGPEAIGVWKCWTRRHGEPLTWRVERDPRVSRHLWFRAPEGLDRITTSVLWGVRKPGGGWERGSKVELVGDGSLIIAPPSLHPRTGQEYRFAVGPDDLFQPAILPAWLAVMATRPEVAQCATLEPIRYAPSLPVRRRHYDKRAVMAAIPPEAKVVLAEQYGVRFASTTPNAAGWCPCYRDESDRHPSASFNVETGYWWAAGVGRSSLLELSVRAGVYPDLCGAIDALGEFFGADERAAS